MKLVISGGQLSSLKKGKAFQLSKQQLQGAPKKGAQYEVEMGDEHIRGLNKALKHGKGYRFKGGSILGSITKVANQTANSISSGVNKASKSAGLTKKMSNALKGVKSSYGKANQWALKNDVGGTVESVKKVVPKSVVNTAITGALLATGMDETTANVMAGSATGALYGTNFGESLKGQGKNAAKGAVTGAVTGALAKTSAKPTVKGDGLKGRHHMAHDYAKGPFVGRSVGPEPKSMVVRTSKGPVIASKSRAAVMKDNQMVDTNTSSGGSFAPLSGGSMVSLGGSFKQVGSGFGTESVTKVTKKATKAVAGSGVNRPAKGSQAAKDKMAALRARRTSGGSMKPL